jgi:hypothetical protein
MATLPLAGYTPPDPNADLSQGFGENHATWAGAGRGAMTGMQYGKYFGAGIVPAASVGALIGAVKARTNNTKNDREDFAKTLGVGNTTDLWAKLNAALPPETAQELQSRATTRIGKHDKTANAKWMEDVQAALNASGAASPQAATAAPAAPVAPPVDPRRQSVIDALKGGGNYRDALVSYLNGGR